MTSTSRRFTALALGALVLVGPTGAAAAVSPGSLAPVPAPRAESGLPPVLIRWPLQAEDRSSPSAAIPPPSVEAAAIAVPADDETATAAPAAGEVPSPTVARALPEAIPPGEATPGEALPTLPPPATDRPPISTVARSTVKAPRGATDDEVGLLLPSFDPPRIDVATSPDVLTPPSEDVRRWTFPEPDGLTWEAEETSKDGDWITLRGDVDIRSGVERIRADEVRLNQITRLLEAKGSIVLDRADARLTGSALEYDLNTNTGVVHDAMGYTGDELTFTSELAEKVAADKYVLRGGTFTSCAQPTPIWQIKASKAVVHINKFVYLWNPRVFFKKVPASYFPWMAFPIKQERSTGFMIPKISTSSLRGVSVQEEFFWAINRSADLTVGGQLWDKYGWRGDLKGRWHFGNMPQAGFFEAVVLHSKDPDFDPGLDQDRYNLRWEHRQDLGEWDLTATGEIGSDQLINLDRPGINTDETQDLQPIFNQKVTMQRRWGKHSLNLIAENDERESQTTRPAPSVPLPANAPDDSTQTRITRNLPLAEYRASGLQLGGKKWMSLSMEGSVGSLTQAVQNRYLYPYATGTESFNAETNSHDYTRADFYPQFRFPLGTSFLQVIPEVALRGTWWSRTEVDTDLSTPFNLDLDTRTETLAGVSGATIPVNYTLGEDEAAFLWGWDAGLTLEGPDLERIYRKEALPGSKRWQHLIEPTIELNYAPEISRAWLPTGDQRSSHYSQRFRTQDATGVLNEMDLRLVNTLRSKRVMPEGAEEESTRDVVIWNLSTKYDFEKPESKGIVDVPAMGSGREEINWWGNIQSDLNFKPTEDIHFSLRNTFHTLIDDITQTTLSGGLDGGWGYTDLAFTSTREIGSLEATSTEASLTGEHWFYKGDRLRIGYDLTREIDEPKRSGTTPGLTQVSPWTYRRLVFSYYNQCLGLSISWEDNAYRALRREREWTFIVSLKELGNFLRYRRRSLN